MLQLKDHESPTKQYYIKCILNLYSLLYYIVMLTSLTKILLQPSYDTMLNCIVITLNSNDLNVYYKVKQIRKISML